MTLVNFHFISYSTGFSVMKKGHSLSLKIRSYGDWERWGQTNNMSVTLAMFCVPPLSQKNNIQHCLGVRHVVHPSRRPSGDVEPSVSHLEVPRLQPEINSFIIFLAQNGRSIPQAEVQLMKEKLTYGC